MPANSLASYRCMSVFLLSCLLLACGGGGSSSNPADTDTPDSDPDPDTGLPNQELTTTYESSAYVYDDWLINNSEYSAFIDDGQTLVNIQDVGSQEIGGVGYRTIESSQVPNYQVEMHQEMVDWLNSRDNPDRQFQNGTSTTAVAGVTYEFGEDIGFVSNNDCVDGGYGYFPNGPNCATDQNFSGNVPAEPVASEELCTTGLNDVGITTYGTKIFSWQDGQSYNSEGVWDNLAPYLEIYSLDICGGHNEFYHHHQYSQCWAEKVGEDYVGHSELYGFAADGYAIYGPYEDTGVLAKSCWVPRDYTKTPDEEGYGCVGFDGAEAGDRNCVLVDPYDPSQGVEASDLDGPTTDEIVESGGGSQFSTESGFYFQDYYYDATCTAQGAEYLDEHTGHYDDVRGYHYHITLNEEPAEGDYVPRDAAFPFTFGPAYAGELPANSLSTSCQETGGGGPGGPP